MSRPGADALRLAFAATAVAMGAGGIDVALATTDTSFDAPLDMVTDMVSGTGGQFAAALAVGAALVGSVLRFNATQLLGAAGAGVAAGAGTGIVTDQSGPIEVETVQGHHLGPCRDEVFQERCLPVVGRVVLRDRTQLGV